MRAGVIIGDSGGSGEVRLSAQFKEEPPMYRADVLKDALFDVWRHYNDARVELGWEPLTEAMRWATPRSLAEEALGHRMGDDHEGG